MALCTQSRRCRSLHYSLLLWHSTHLVRGCTNSAISWNWPCCSKSVSDSLHCIGETIIIGSIIWSRRAHVWLFSIPDCSHLHFAFFHTSNDGFLVCSHVNNDLVLWHSLIMHVQISSRILRPISWSSSRSALQLSLSLITYKYKLRTINCASLPTLAMKFLPTWHRLLIRSWSVERLAARSSYRLASWVVELLNFLSNPCTSVHECIFFIVLFEIWALIGTSTSIFLSFVSTQLLLQSWIVHATSCHCLIECLQSRVRALDGCA